MSTLRERVAFLGAMFVETPLVKLADPRMELFAKLEFCNPNGSSKDRSAYNILRRAVERGEITERTVVVESSSGNFAISMASLCRTLGIQFLPVIDPNCNALTETYLDMMCARVEKVTERDSTGSFLLARLLRVQELCEQLEHSYWPNQYANVDSARAHYELTGGEICRALPELDHLFIGVSTGGTISGLSNRVKEHYPTVKVIAVDAEGSAVFGMPPRLRRLPGLGSSMVPALCTQALIDDVIIVPEPDAITGCLQLVRDHGIYAGGSSGSVYSAIGRYFDGHPVSGRPTVAFLCADRGTAYADTIYNPAWVSEHYGEEPVLPDTDLLTASST